MMDMRSGWQAISALALTLCLGAALADPPPATAQFRVFAIGSLFAVALKDGSLREPNDGESFSVGQPPAEVASVLKSGGAPTDHFEFSIQPLLVRAGSRVLLFDTGAGSNFGLIAGALPKSMQAADIDPATVTDIFISHSHGDHIGGLVTASGALAFPHAAIHMSAPEWSYLSGMSAERGQQIGLAHVDALARTIKPKVVPFTPDTEIIPGLVKAVDIKGHTPGHSGYLIGSGADTLLYIGDTLHSYVVSVREPQWHTSFDADPATAADTRVAFVERVAASGQRLYAVHFPFPGVGKIVKQGTHYTWVPESLD
jgi:glyoxylase-like metal-dependent hydrolase (beta-lactamase superfamily II)